MSDTTDDARITSLEKQMVRCMDLMNMISATLKIYGMEIHALKTGTGGVQSTAASRDLLQHMAPKPLTIASAAQVLPHAVGGAEVGATA